MRDYRRERSVLILTRISAGIGSEGGALQRDALAMGICDELSRDVDLQGQSNADTVSDISEEEGEGGDLQSKKC